MGETSLFCRTCRRQRLHRSSSTLGVVLLGVALLLGFLARGSGDAIAFLAIPLLVLVPPAPIRCQSCGVVNARQWGFWFVRATLGGLYGFLAFQVMAHPERLR